MCVDQHERTCTHSWSGDSYFSAQLIPVNLQRTKIRCFTSDCFPASLFSMCWSWKLLSWCCAGGWNEGKLRCVVPFFCINDTSVPSHEQFYTVWYVTCGNVKFKLTETIVWLNVAIKQRQTESQYLCFLLRRFVVIPVLRTKATGGRE